MRCFDMTEEEIHCSTKIGTKPSIFALPPNKKTIDRTPRFSGRGVCGVWSKCDMSLLAFKLAYGVS